MALYQGSAAERAARGEVAFEDVIAAPTLWSPQPGTLVVLDRRAHEAGIPWHYVGLVLLTLAGVSFAVALGGEALRDLTVLALFVAAVGLGTALWLRGRPRLRREEIGLLWLNTHLRLLRVREAANQQRLSESASIDFEDVREVLYSVRPVRMDRVSVDGAAVFLRLDDGTVWPVIPASHDKEASYRVATTLSRTLGVRVKQVGAGWRASRD